MADTNTQTVIFDSRNRPALIIADTLSSADIGQTIPEGTLGWDKNSGSLSRFVSGSWVTSLVQGALTADTVTANFVGQLTGNVFTAAGGAVAIMATDNNSYVRYGTTQETFTYGAGADTVLTGVIAIPDNAYVTFAKVKIDTIIAGDSVAKLDVGLSVFNTADADALTPTQIATVTTGVKQRQSFFEAPLGPTASDFITVSAFANDGTTPKDPTSGVLTVTIGWVEIF